MVDIQTVSIAIASAGVFLAAIYYVLQIRHQTRIRKTDLYMRLYSTGTSNEFWDAFWKVISLQVKDYQDYVKQYGSILTENPMNRAFFTIATYYELVGTLLYRKLIDLVSVYDVWGSSSPIMLYEKIKPLVLGVRREFGEPASFLGFEYLCDELKTKEPQLKKAIRKWLKDSNTSAMK
jgi:hypothetical protein